MPRRQRGMYLAYSIVTSYEDDQGVLQLPIAGDDDEEAVFVQTHSPISRMVVEFFMVRLGEKPQVPSAEAALKDKNLVLLKKTPRWETKQIWVDGHNFLYGAAGSYIYGLKKPIQPNENVEIPDPVYIISSPGTVYRPRDFDKKWRPQ